VQPDVVTAVLTAVSLLGEIEQGGEGSLKGRLALGRGFLSGQPFPCENADQVVEAVLAVHA